MRSKRTIKTILKLLLTFFFLAIVVVGIRCFVVESYRVSTSAMEETLKQGDLIVVNKLKTKPDRNQVILFSSPLRKDSLYRPLFLSRCIGLPGDTIRVSSDGYTINGRFFPLSPHSLCRYQLDNSAVDVFFKTLHRLRIPIRNLQNEKTCMFLSLTPFEEYKIREELPETVNRGFLKQTTGDYSLIVPRRDRPYRLTREALIACKEAILCESKLPVAFRNDKAFIDGRETDFFFFQQDYYWVLSDHETEGIDSRHLGFIPAENIEGTAWCCWFSPRTKSFFKRIN